MRLTLLLLILGLAPVPNFGPVETDPDGALECMPTDPPAYYAIDLVPTRRVPGTGLAEGVGEMRFARSPFGVAVSAKGQYKYDLVIKVNKLRPARRGVYAAWVSTPNLDQVVPLGVLDLEKGIHTQVDWNKFLVIITLEPDAKTLGKRWTGPIVMRGLSRSGLMHTMAGHGPFEDEPCAKYGYR